MKKVTVDNLEALGPERLASILFDVAQGRPDLKRRPRMELAAQQGAEPLAAEIDKRLNSLATSRGKIGWRQRPAVVREIDGLRQLILGRLAGLDLAGAAERAWMLIRLAPAILRRMTDKDGSAADMFGRVAEDLGRLIAPDNLAAAAEALETSIATGPALGRGGCRVCWRPPLRRSRQPRWLG